MDESYTNGYNDGQTDAYRDCEEHEHSLKMRISEMNQALEEIRKYNGDTTKVESIIRNVLKA
jgi:hypothetical protein